MARAQRILFRIFYSTSFTTVFLLLIAMIGVSPFDKLYESYKRDRIVDMFIISGAYVLTALIAAFLYASRLYTNRSILRAIPKYFLPIEKDDLPGKKVSRLIEECLASSAVVAYHARPRSKRIEVEMTGAGQRILAVTKQSKVHHHVHHLTQEEEMRLTPKWGPIDHAGWHSPAADEMPNLEYASVVDELIDLIEAQAVSLAPVDPMGTPSEADGSPMKDSRIVDVLTRPETIGMRPYLAMLVDLGTLPDSPLNDAFLAVYERARFASTPISTAEFEDLMRLFAELLRSMEPFDIEQLEILLESPDEQFLPLTKLQSSSSTAPSTFSASSIVHVKHSDGLQAPDLPPRRVSEDSVPSISSAEMDEYGSARSRSLYTAPTSRSIHTAPTSHSGGLRDNTNRSLSRPSLASRRMDSARSMGSIGASLRATHTGPSSSVVPRSQGQGPNLRAQTSNHSFSRTRSQASLTASSRSGNSGTGAASVHSTGSVIRLAEARDDGALPYVIDVPVAGRLGRRLGR